MNIEPGKVIRLGTRGSLLARAQSRQVADELMRRWPGVQVELKLITTSGDRMTDRPLAEGGGKGLFTKELELALLGNEIDFAVHSYKDVPVTMPLVDQSELVIAAVPVREDPQDVVVMLKPERGPHPAGARIGTSSLRRRCQILEKIPDAMIVPLRGNIDTRLRKLRAGEFDVIVLAAAGLKRAGLFDALSMRSAELIPASGQGALALQCRRFDSKTCALLGVLNDETTAACVDAERALVKLLKGDCHSPIAAFATVEDSGIKLIAVVGGRDGNPPLIRAQAQVPGTIHDFAPLVADVFRQLNDQGVMTMLHGV